MSFSLGFHIYLIAIFIFIFYFLELEKEKTNPRLFCHIVFIQRLQKPGF